jgi:hypothetical protein
MFNNNSLRFILRKNTNRRELGGNFVIYASEPNKAVAFETALLEQD